MIATGRPTEARGSSHRALRSREPRAIQAGAPRSRRTLGARQPTDERGGDHGDKTTLHPEVEAFARWFCDWWLRRGGHDGVEG
jgi:hypothetical protein